MREMESLSEKSREFECCCFYCAS